MTLQEIIDESKNIVFFGGAGVSTESGIPDFRSADGLYNQQHTYSPEEILSHSFYVSHTKEFYDFYRDNMLFLDAEPNSAHLKLAELEKAGKLSAVVTQNIDGLHQKAGSKNVYELHGSVHRNYCTKCRKFFGVEYVVNNTPVPECDVCGGVVKPDVVLYEEGLDSATIEGAVNAIANADCLIVAGTSLNVYPAAGFIKYFSGKHFVLINKDKTPADKLADLVIHGKVGEILSEIEVR
ncbi:MAG: NAD-dependent protein deacylase [Eubacterium sp.]|nr:NAD-dependent protein deacylase [Eubacterium sp.]